MQKFYWLAIAGGLVAAVGCTDPLVVTNENSPDVARVFAKPGDVEALIGGTYKTANEATFGGSNNGVQTQLLVMSFENSSSLANFGMGTRSSLPRNAVNNTPGNAIAGGNYKDFALSARSANSAAIGLSQLAKAGFTIGSPEKDKRAKAFAFFSMGVGNGNVALVYDSGAVVSEKTLDIVPPLVGYPDLMKAALGNLDSAIAYANDPAVAALTIPNAWLPLASEMSMSDFVRFARSYKARFRAEVARNVGERAAVDWALVIADANAGITSDVNITMGNGWNVADGQHYTFTEWHQQSPIFIGMADSTGGYDNWLATPLINRAAYLIGTADQRFPSGDTRAAQRISSGGAISTPIPPRANIYFRNRSGTDPVGEPYHNSQYDYYRFQVFSNAGRNGPYPVMTAAEIRLLAAEGYMRTGNISEMTKRIDVSRVAIGGLPPVSGVTSLTAPVPGGQGCVPRTPVAPSYTSSACGNLFEALKWEKRMETAYTAYGAWYFDSRGWGDLAQGTAVQFPVPYQEMAVRGKKEYSLGGIGGPSGSPRGTYGY